MVFALEDLGWPNGARIGRPREGFVVLSLEVAAIVFWSGKGLCAKWTLCSDVVLAVFFSHVSTTAVQI